MKVYRGATIWRGGRETRGREDVPRPGALARVGRIDRMPFVEHTEPTMFDPARRAEHPSGPHYGGLDPLWRPFPRAILLPGKVALYYEPWRGCP